MSSWTEGIARHGKKHLGETGVLQGQETRAPMPWCRGRGSGAGSEGYSDLPLWFSDTVWWLLSVQELDPPLPKFLGSGRWCSCGLCPVQVVTGAPTGQASAMSLLPSPPHRSFQKPILAHQVLCKAVLSPGGADCQSKALRLSPWCAHLSRVP